MTAEDATPVTPAMARAQDIARDDEDTTTQDGPTVSSAGSSFSDPETSNGGADAVPSTPDSVPRDNHAENDDLSDDDLLA